MDYRQKYAEIPLLSNNSFGFWSPSANLTRHFVLKYRALKPGGGRVIAFAEGDDLILITQVLACIGSRSEPMSLASPSEVKWFARERAT
jgi:hypothetical protein